MQEGSLLAVSLFSIIVLIVAVINIHTLFQCSRHGSLFSLLLLAWLTATAGIALSGILKDFSTVPPRIAPVVLIAIGTVIALAFSPLGTNLATQVSLTGLVGFQVFRLPLEGVLFLLHHEAVVPVQMTFAGLNFDLLSGLAALWLAWLAARGRLPTWGLLLWNLAAFGLLINIVLISILSMPTPLRMFENEPANTFIATIPFVWLPTFLVPMALGGHLLVFRRLWIMYRSQEKSPISTRQTA